MQNAFDDFDTQVQVEEVYRDDVMELYELYQDRYWVGQHLGRPAVFDKVLGLRAYGGTHHGMVDMMHSLAGDDAYFAQHGPFISSSKEHLMGGDYHGPSNEAGLTSKEYWEMMAEYEDEQDRIRNEW